MKTHFSTQDLFILRNKIIIVSVAASCGPFLSLARVCPSGFAVPWACVAVAGAALPHAPSLITDSAKYDLQCFFFYAIVHAAVS